MKQSPVIRLLTLVRESATRQSWQALNAALQQALRIAISGGFEFAIGDFAKLALDRREGGFSFGYWCGRTGTHGLGEYYYSMACGRDRATANRSAAMSYEVWLGRPPFIVKQPRSRSGIRLAVGVEFEWLGRIRWRVTSFSEDQSRLNAVAVEGSRRISITHKDIRNYHAWLKDQAKQREAAA